MTHPALTARLAEIEKRLNATTPGQWRAEITPQGPCGQMCYADAVLIPIPYPTKEPGKFIREPTSGIWCDQRACPEWRDNLRFIASAPDNTKLLLSLVRTQMEALENMIEPGTEKYEGTENQAPRDHIVALVHLLRAKALICLTKLEEMCR